MPPSGGGDKRGKGTDGSLSPLDTPDLPLSHSAKHSRLNGGYGGSVPCVGQLLGRITAPNLLCVNRSAVSARPSGAGRQLSAAKGSASIKDVPVEHQTPLWAPRFSPRNRRESRPKERLGSQEGQGHLGVPAPIVSAARRRQCPVCPSAAILASSGAPLYRRR